MRQQAVGIDRLFLPHALLGRFLPALGPYPFRYGLFLCGADERGQGAELHRGEPREHAEPLKIDRGYALIPDVPGTGVSWNEDAIAKYAIEL